MAIFNKMNFVLPLMLLFVVSSPASGQIEVSFSSASVTASDSLNTGSFEILVTHELPTNPELIGFQVQFSIFGVDPGESQISATKILDPSDRVYVFAPTSTGPTGKISDQGVTVMLGDLLFSGSAPLESGQAVARIDFELDLAAEDLVDHTIRIDTDPSRTFFVDQNNVPIPFTTQDGTIQVNAEEPLLLGDVNLDRVVNFLDISAFVSVLTTEGFQAEADIDQNEVVNFLDIVPFVEILTAP